MAVTQKRIARAQPLLAGEWRPSISLAAPGEGLGVRREGILLANSSGTPSSDLTGCRATFPTERTTQYSFKTRSCQEKEWLGRMMQRTGAVTRYWFACSASDLGLTYLQENVNAVISNPHPLQLQTYHVTACSFFSQVEYVAFVCPSRDPMQLTGDSPTALSHSLSTESSLQDP